MAQQQLRASSAITICMAALPLTKESCLISLVSFTHRLIYTENNATPVRSR